MEYQQFISVVEEEVKKNVESNVKVNVHTVVKNNGRERRGLTLLEKGINISPTIYLEEYFERYKEGKPIPDIIEDILELYGQVRFSHSFEGENLQNYNKIKDKVVYKVINYKKNSKILEELPHIKYLDLAIVFYVLLELNHHGTATMLIRNEHVKEWGLNFDDIKELAYSNTEELLPPSFRTMKAVIQEMLMQEQEGPDDEDYMYILTNNVRNFGAGCILYRGVLDQIGHHFNENYYIIPSSVHEVIVLPESHSPGSSDLIKMIREINSTQLEEDEVLSETVYYYNRKKRELNLIN